MTFSEIQKLPVGTKLGYQVDCYDLRFEGVITESDGRKVWIKWGTSIPTPADQFTYPWDKVRILERPPEVVSSTSLWANWNTSDY